MLEPWPRVVCSLGPGSRIPFWVLFGGSKRRLEPAADREGPRHAHDRWLRIGTKCRTLAATGINQRLDPNLLRSVGQAVVAILDNSLKGYSGLVHDTWIYNRGQTDHRRCTAPLVALDASWQLSDLSRQLA